MVKKYFGNSLHVENSTIDDEWVNIKDTDWYKDMKNTYSLGSNLAFYRKEKKLTQESLGSILGVTKQYVSDMEYERRSISKDMAKKNSSCP